jgi:uncharacterized protein (TIGR03086 family)
MVARRRRPAVTLTPRERSPRARFTAPAVATVRRRGAYVGAMEPMVAYRRARTEFDRRLALIGPADWSRPTPCTGWSVRDLVSHVVGGNTMTAKVLAGASRDEGLAVFAADLLGDDPLGAYAASAEAAEAAFEAPGALEAICHHPAADLPGAQILGFRIGDLAVHAWDLARSLGGDEQLDAELVAYVWGSLQPMAPIIATIGVFGTGPSGAVPESAPLQTRLLDLVGRRP